MTWMNPSRPQITKHRAHPHPGPPIISRPITGHVQDVKKTTSHFVSSFTNQKRDLFICISKMSGWEMLKSYSFDHPLVAHQILHILLTRLLKMYDTTKEKINADRSPWCWPLLDLKTFNYVKMNAPQARTHSLGIFCQSSHECNNSFGRFSKLVRNFWRNRKATQDEIIQVHTA